MPEAGDVRLAQVVRVEARARLERLVGDAGRPHAVEPVRPRPVNRAVPRVHAPDRELALERVRLDHADARRLVALLQILDLDQPALLRALAERAHELLLVVRDTRRGRLCELELAERVLQLL